jgi:sulfopyruvate decarboxylase subunit alpha
VFTGPEISSLLAELGFTHVVWVPDTATGPWEAALESSKQLQLIRVCREGEAWPLAAGLHLGGKLPLIVMQTTGLYESGDALRNVLYDLQLPLHALIGVRNWLVPDSRDSAKTFTEPIIKAWGLNAVWIEADADKPKFAEHVRHCREQGIAGVTMLAEGAP